MTVASRVARWLPIVVAAATLAMHGLANEHTTATAPMSMATATSPLMHTAASSSTLTGEPSVTDARSHVMSMLGACVATVPVLFFLLLVGALLLRRCRMLPRLHRAWEHHRSGRDPPCPPPCVRGVCLT